MAKSIVKQITFPIQLLKVLEPKAKRYGYSFPAYVRYVLTKDMEKEFERENNIIIDDDFASDLKAGVKESKENRVVTLRNEKEIRDHFTTIANEEN